MALILASGSRARSEMLKAAGVEFESQNPLVDEEPVKEALLAEGAPAHHIADMLAEFKALAVSSIKKNSFVIGSDQILSCEGKCYSKADTMEGAKKQLQALSGKKHSLISAVVIAKDGQVIWREIDKAHLTMRKLSDDFIDDYLLECGDAILSSVGCYHLEGKGAQLFEKVEGDYFTVLGLPLLKVLHFLRQQGLMIT